MDLRKYLDELPRGGLADVAARLGISAVYVSQLAARQNNREASPELCVRIERATGGAVMRWNLRPDDWHLIWPELIGAPGAPAVDGDVRRHGADGTPANGARIEEAQRAA